MTRFKTSQPTGTVRSQHGRVWGFLMRRVINPTMRRLLASRIHRLMGSDFMMVLAFQGRRSGATYEFPIGYMQEGDTLISYTPFGWWRNLRGGAPVTVLLRGATRVGTANVRTDTAAIENGLAEYLRNNPGDAKYFRVALDANKQPDLEDVARAAEKTAQIRIQLD